MAGARHRTLTLKRTRSELWLCSQIRRVQVIPLPLSGSSGRAANSAILLAVSSCAARFNRAK